MQAAADPRPREVHPNRRAGSHFHDRDRYQPARRDSRLCLDGGFNLDGFLLSKGKFTTIDFPGAVLNIATDINPQGEIVGVYDDSSGNRHGFLRSNGVFRTINVTEAMLTITSR